MYIFARINTINFKQYTRIFCAEVCSIFTFMNAFTKILSKYQDGKMCGKLQMWQDCRELSSESSEEPTC